MTINVQTNGSKKSADGAEQIAFDSISLPALSNVSSAGSQSGNVSGDKALKVAGLFNWSSWFGTEKPKEKTREEQITEIEEKMRNDPRYTFLVKFCVESNSRAVIDDVVTYRRSRGLTYEQGDRIASAMGEEVWLRCGLDTEYIYSRSRF